MTLIWKHFWILSHYKCLNEDGFLSTEFIVGLMKTRDICDSFPTAVDKTFQRVNFIKSRQNYRATDAASAFFKKCSISMGFQIVSLPILILSADRNLGRGGWRRMWVYLRVSSYRSMEHLTARHKRWKNILCDNILNIWRIGTKCSLQLKLLNARSSQIVWASLT